MLRGRNINTVNLTVGQLLALRRRGADTVVIKIKGGSSAFLLFKNTLDELRCAERRISPSADVRGVLTVHVILYAALR